jgi:hypothetical protein
MEIESFIQELEKISSLIKKSALDGEIELDSLSIQIGISKDELKELMKNGLLDQNRGFS